MPQQVGSLQNGKVMCTFQDMIYPKGLSDAHGSQGQGKDCRCDGRFQFRNMSFGIANSTAIFNRMMRKLLNNIQGADSLSMSCCHMHVKHTCKCLQTCLVVLANLILHLDQTSVNPAKQIQSLWDI